MNSIARSPRVLDALVLCLSCTLASGAWSQPNQGRPAQPSQGDVFNTQGERGGPCDTNIWIRAHGGRWDRCQYERECPPVDTKFYGEPDRFSTNDRERMNGYARCAVDPCNPGGAQCWGRPGSDAINTNGAPGNPPPQKPPPLVRIPGGYDPCANPVPAPGCPNAPSGGKTLKRVWETPTGGGAADAGKMVEGIDRCIREKSELSYYVSPATRQSGSGLASYDSAAATLAYNPAKLNQQKPYIRAYVLAGAFADHIGNLEERRNGKTGTARARQQKRDYVIGFVTHCLRDESTLPRAANNDDPRLQFQDYLFLEGGAVPLNPATMARGIDFDRGWKDFLMGFPFGRR